MKESELQNMIRLKLSEYGIVLRLNVGTLKTPDGRYIRTGLPQGTPDLLFIGQGRVAFIEVKIKGRKPTTAQQRFLKRMHELGHAAGVAYSVEEALKIIEKE